MSRTSLSFFASKSEAVAATARSITSLDRDAGHVPGEFAGFDLGQVEHVVDELGEPFAFTDDDFEIFDDLLLGLLDLAIVFGDEREEALFEAAANDLGEAEHGGERRAQLVADGGEERALRGVGFFGGGSGVAGFFKELGVVEGDADGGGDGREQALIGFGEAAFLIGGLHADDADDLAAGRDRHAEIRGSARPICSMPSCARLRSMSSLMSSG